MKQLKQNHNHRLSRWLFFNKKNKSLRNQGLIRARDGVRTRDPDLGKVVLYQLSHSRKKRVMGIEPTYSAWKADVLPLNYTRKRYSYILIKKLAFVNKFFGGYKRFYKPYMIKS